MIKTMDPRMVEAVTYAVHKAIATVGMDGLRATSMFPSSAKKRAKQNYLLAA